MPYIVNTKRPLVSCHCSEIHALTDKKIDYVKDNFCEKLEHVFNTFPKYHTKILLSDFNAKCRRENIFKPTTVN
jgi:hypothetical protein